MILASLILIQTISLDLRELVKIQDLIEHANYHNERYGDDFFTFLSKHYGDLKKAHQENRQNERKDHDQLPFHQLDHVQLSLFDIEKDSGTHDEFEYQVNHRFYYRNDYHHLFSKELLQPPRTA